MNYFYFSTAAQCSFERLCEASVESVSVAASDVRDAYEIEFFIKKILNFYSKIPDKEWPSGIWVVDRPVVWHSNKKEWLNDFLNIKYWPKKVAKFKYFCRTLPY